MTVARRLSTLEVEVAKVKTLDDVGEGNAAVARLRRWLSVEAGA
jgi:hypothetical protein